MVNPVHETQQLYLQDTLKSPDSLSEIDPLICE